MILKDFKQALKDDFADAFEVKLELDHCLNPDIIKFKLDPQEKIITIIQGNRGT